MTDTTLRDTLNNWSKQRDEQISGWIDQLVRIEAEIDVTHGSRWPDGEYQPADSSIDDALLGIRTARRALVEFRETNR